MNVVSMIKTSHTIGGTVVLKGFSNVAPIFYEVSIIPYRGFRIVDVLINGESKGAVATYRFNNPTRNQSLYAVFAVDTTNYTITAVSSDNGTISYKGEKVVLQGTSKYYKIVPDVGYLVDKVLINGNEVSIVNNGYNFTNIQQDNLIEVSFKFSGNYFSLGGTICDSKSNPLHGVVVSIDNVTDTTSQDGTFLLKNIKKGRRVLNAVKGGYANYIADININSEEKNYQISMLSIPPTYRITGTVTDQYKYGVPYVNITMGEYMATTDGDGTYSINNVSAGNYDMYLVKYGYYAKKVNLTIDSNKGFVDVMIIQIPT